MHTPPAIRSTATFILTSIIRGLGHGLLSAALLVGLTTCQSNAQQRTIEGTTVDTSQILSTFRDSLPRAFEAAVKAGDFEAQAQFYTEDAVYSHPMTPSVQGRDSIRAVLKQTTPPGATADVQPITTRILGPDCVYDYGTVTLSFMPEGADQRHKITSTYFALFHRTEDGWKITREALSLNHPPPTPQ